MEHCERATVPHRRKDGELIYWDGGYHRPLFYDGVPALTLVNAAYGSAFNLSDPQEQMARLGIVANNTAVAVTNL